MTASKTRSIRWPKGGRDECGAEACILKNACEDVDDEGKTLLTGRKAVGVEKKGMARATRPQPQRLLQCSARETSGRWSDVYRPKDHDQNKGGSGGGICSDKPSSSKTLALRAPEYHR